MRFDKSALVYFSPTHTGRRVAEGVAKGSGGETETLDLTLPGACSEGAEIGAGTLAVIGAPVYRGRAAPDAVRRLGRVRGNGAPAVVIATYGNRDYEDALLELADLAEDQGFVVVAAGAFIGEHSYSTPDRPLSPGRPDAEDMAGAQAFGAAVREKLAGLENLEDAKKPEVPGNRPYKDAPAGPGAAPETDEALCDLCGACAEVCPVGAIQVGETVVTDADACVRCCACVRDCPCGARAMTAAPVEKARGWLQANCSARRAPELFM